MITHKNKKQTTTIRRFCDRPGTNGDNHLFADFDTAFKLTFIDNIPVCFRFAASLVSMDGSILSV